MTSDLLNVEEVTVNEVYFVDLRDRAKHLFSVLWCSTYLVFVRDNVPAAAAAAFAVDPIELTDVLLAKEMEGKVVTWRVNLRANPHSLAPRAGTAPSDLWDWAGRPFPPRSMSRGQTSRTEIA